MAPEERKERTEISPGVRPRVGPSVREVIEAKGEHVCGGMTQWVVGLAVEVAGVAEKHERDGFDTGGRWVSFIVGCQ